MVSLLFQKPSELQNIFMYNKNYASDHTQIVYFEIVLKPIRLLSREVGASSSPFLKLGAVPRILKHTFYILDQFTAANISCTRVSFKIAFARELNY